MKCEIELARRALLSAFALAVFAPCARATLLQRWTGKPAAPPLDLLTIDGTRCADSVSRKVVWHFWGPVSVHCESFAAAAAYGTEIMVDMLMVTYQEDPHERAVSQARA